MTTALQATQAVRTGASALTSPTHSTFSWEHVAILVVGIAIGLLTGLFFFVLSMMRSAPSRSPAPNVARPSSRIEDDPTFQAGVGVGRAREQSAQCQQNTAQLLLANANAQAGRVRREAETAAARVRAEVDDVAARARADLARAYVPVP